MNLNSDLNETEPSDTNGFSLVSGEIGALSHCCQSSNEQRPAMEEGNLAFDIGIFRSYIAPITVLR